MRNTLILRALRRTPVRSLRTWLRPWKPSRVEVTREPSRSDLFWPFKEMEEFMSSTFMSPFMRSFFMNPFSSPFFQPSPELQSWMRSASAMAMEFNETDKEYTIKVDVPGVPKESIKVKVDAENFMLTVSAERKLERESPKAAEKAEGEVKDKEQQVVTEHWSERAYGHFSRSVSLPPDADVDSIEATYKDGVLSLRVPKKTQASSGKEKVIDIK